MPPKSPTFSSHLVVGANNEGVSIRELTHRGGVNERPMKQATFPLTDSLGMKFKGEGKFQGNEY